LDDAQEAQLRTWATTGMPADSTGAVSAFVSASRPDVPFGDAMPSPYATVAHSERCRGYLELLRTMRVTTEADAAAWDIRVRSMHAAGELDPTAWADLQLVASAAPPPSFNVSARVCL